MLRAAPLLILAALLTGTPAAGRGPSAAHADREARAVIAAEQSRLRAFHDADRGAFLRLVTDDLVMTHGGGEVFNRDQEAALMRPSSAERPLPALTIEDVDVRLYGATAVMVGNLVETAADGRRELVLRFTNTYRREGRQWRLAAGQLTTLSRERPIVSVGREVLRQYAGHYRNASGRVLEVVEDPSGLAVIAGGERLLLQPISERQFAVPGADVVLAFIRDRAGRVIGLINRRPNGDMLEEVKID